MLPIITALQSGQGAEIFCLRPIHKVDSTGNHDETDP